MDQVQTLQLLDIITTAYRTVELTDEEAALWETMLADIPFERAAANLHRYIRFNHFPPTIADIRCELLEQEEQQLMLESAQTHLNKMALLEQGNSQPPEGFWESIREKLRGGTA